MSEKIHFVMLGSIVFDKIVHVVQYIVLKAFVTLEMSQ